DRNGSKLALYRPRDRRDQSLRPAFGLAELDLYPPERDRRAGCAQGLRQRRAAKVRLGASVGGKVWRSITTSGSRTMSVSPTTGHCSGLSNNGSRDFSTGGGKWDRPLFAERTCICVQRQQPTRTVGRAMAMWPWRIIAGGSFSPIRCPIGASVL